TLWQPDGETQVLVNDVLSDGTFQALRYKTVADAHGSGSLTWSVKDDGGTSNGGQDTLTQSLSITVSAVNDAPSFVKGPDQTVSKNSSSQTVNGWATSISKGPSNESSQSLSSFSIVSNSDTGLFSAGPAIDASGNLTYTPSTGAV